MAYRRPRKTKKWSPPKFSRKAKRGKGKRAKGGGGARGAGGAGRPRGGGKTFTRKRRTRGGKVVTEQVHYRGGGLRVQVD